jgi:hypothetical protein
VLKVILRSALGLLYLSGEMITKKTMSGLNEALRSFSLGPRAALFNARILESIALTFLLLPRLEAINVGSLNNEPGSMLGHGIHPINEVVRGGPGRLQIALTFDAGAGADALPELLAALKDASVKCTFFPTGEWVQRYPSSVKQIVAARHEIGNHAWSHRDLTTLSDGDISWEITHADAEIQPLYGRVGAPKSSSFIIARIAGQPDQVLDGAIVLFHVGNDRIAVEAKNVSTQGFDVAIRTWLDTHVWSCGGFWIAYTA